MSSTLTVFANEGMLLVAAVGRLDLHLAIVAQIQVGTAAIRIAARLLHAESLHE